MTEPRDVLAETLRTVTRPAPTNTEAHYPPMPGEPGYNPQRQTIHRPPSGRRGAPSDDPNRDRDRDTAPVLSPFVRRALSRELPAWAEPGDPDELAIGPVVRAEGLARVQPLRIAGGDKGYDKWLTETVDAILAAMPDHLLVRKDEWERLRAVEVAAREYRSRTGAANGRALDAAFSESTEPAGETQPGKQHASGLPEGWLACKAGAGYGHTNAADAALCVICSRPATDTGADDV